MLLKASLFVFEGIAKKKIVPEAPSRRRTPKLDDTDKWSERREETVVWKIKAEVV